jgi:serine/threonine protein kinase HipA of HipAB toxin-antitoxin module
VVYRNIASLGAEFEEAWKRILLADAVFVNTDRHMRNFGVIRSSRTGEVLRLAPNFDNNQAYLANPSGTYSDRMLKLYMKQADDRDYQNLKVLTDEMKKYPYLKHAFEACHAFLK